MDERKKMIFKRTQIQLTRDNKYCLQEIILVVAIIFGFVGGMCLLIIYGDPDKIKTNMLANVLWNICSVVFSWGSFMFVLYRVYVWFTKSKN